MIRDSLAIIRADLAAEGGIREAIESTKAAILCCVDMIAIALLVQGVLGNG